jgi:hypothetical protein
VLEIRTPPYAVTARKETADGFPAGAAEIAKELLPSLIAILIVLAALSLPVLLILWRLHQSYS